MRIILTHEQTDFDGLASLLGAHLIDDVAVPILPRRLNRNVRGFLTLYGAALPFVDPRDFRSDKIDSVCLVDTQSLVSIKGMGKNTRVKVIDHHTLRGDVPAHWEITTDETGATTTLFVEAIQNQKIHLSAIQATLLLLGIYEDTGSLSYTRTTSRDIRAAAYLIDEGASLSIAKDFLNHPLSLDQQALYEQLQQAAQPHSSYGYSVIIALGDAKNTDEELSTIAHKLRDTLDPDALFLLIETRAGVQLICRSTSDNIDVAQIAAHFGGGGHPRAAAGLIKDRPVKELHTELVEMLPKFVQPPITVGKIMSRSPQVIAPETPAEEVSQRMQRYGHEGYPVVEGGRIVGLLTRRAVDRAISHRLNLPASSLMKAGDAHVHPDQSVEHLQNVMTNTGWGQIPVIDPDNHEILGIVTRTDLLNTLAPETPHPGHRNLSEQLQQALPSPRLALLRAIAESAQQQRAALYIVGGFVRDLLLNRPSLDFDLVVEGDGIALAQAVAKHLGGRVTTHKRFGTAKWHLAEQSEANAQSDLLLDLTTCQPPLLSLDFITARTEFYTHPTALPTVERGSIKLDLHRRDFTINTLALRLHGHHYGELHDHWGGLSDLQKGTIRVLHSLSFVDDPTRMLRAIRYEQRYQFKIGERTRQLLLEARPLLDRVSGDRIRHEIDNILDEANAADMITRLNELGLLEAIHKDLAWDDQIAEKIAALEAHTPAPAWNLAPGLDGGRLKKALAYILWLSPIPIYRIQGVIKRLKLRRTLAETIRAACFIWHELHELRTEKPSQIVARLDKIPPLAVYGLYHAADDAHIQDTLKKYTTTWRQIAPHASGHDLRAYGIPPGPVYKNILTRLRQAWIDGEVTSRDEEIILLEKLITEQK